MEYSISFHTESNSKSISLAHNRREKNLINRENQKQLQNHPDWGERIKTGGKYEIWEDHNPRNVYCELFEDAQDKWNKKQIIAGKKDRCISDYYQFIHHRENTAKAAKHPYYETIIQIGSKDQALDEHLCRAIYQDYLRHFKKDNASLHIIQAAYHADESGCPHLHLVWVPVANCKRGMSKQNSLTGALQELGFHNGKIRSDNVQTRFQDSERRKISEICSHYGVNVAARKETSAEHLSVEEYRSKKEAEDAKSVLAETKKLLLDSSSVRIKKNRLRQLEETELAYKRADAVLTDAGNRSKASENALISFQQAYKKLNDERKIFEQEKERYSQNINRAANKKTAWYRKQVEEFLSHKGLLKEFSRVMATAEHAYRAGKKIAAKAEKDFSSESDERTP